MKKVILDIGTHKTGTTSRQEFLGDRRGWLRSYGVDFYEGFILNNNHVEIHMACMDEDRSSPAKLLHKDAYNPKFLRSSVADRVSSFISNSSCPVLLFSAEGLSYLRYKRELDRLFDIFPNCSVTIVVYLRDRVSFLKSYKDTLKSCQIPFSDEPGSFAYVAEDTWLTDYERFSRLYVPGQNCDSVCIYDYNQISHTFGSVIPHFLSEVLGIKTIPDEASSYWLNRT